MTAGGDVRQDPASAPNASKADDHHRLHAAQGNPSHSTSCIASLGQRA